MTTETKATKHDLFMKLSALDVSAYTEEKNNLTYLGWGAAYAVLMSVCDDVVITNLKSSKGATSRQHYDGITSEVREEESPSHLFRSGTGGEVRVHLGLTYRGVVLGHTESLPVLQNGTKPIAYENITAADVNKTLKRCFVKAAAHFGLGLNLYIKEASGVAPNPANIVRSMQPLDDRLDELRAKLDACTTTDEVKLLHRSLLADEKAVLADAVVAKGKALK